MTPESPGDPPPGDASGIKIHNWADDKEPISDETELVRYMKLESFLLFLSSRVFVPTLGRLQDGDRWESRIPAKSDLYYCRKLWPVVLPYQEWLDKVALGKTVPKDYPGSYPTIPRLKSLSEI